ncbi:MAG: replication-associated recombination protein A [Chlamydiota bacterium]
MTPPLADLLRPKTIADVYGQDHLLGPKGFITRTIDSGAPLSIILWGPPGCGKTTIAHLYAQAFNARFISFSAVLGCINDLRKIVKEAESTPLFNSKIVLFVDEIHRFNKAQQDAFLPYVEKGIITLIGATTENPSFTINNALLSRVRVLTLAPLGDQELKGILSNYESNYKTLPLDSECRQLLVNLAQGDGRYLLNMIENIATLPAEESLNSEQLMPLIQKRSALYDKDGDGHYNLISALHKALRGSDPDAALYWLARMIEGGEDPLYIARRLIRFASEDVGLADPQALTQALAARESYHMLGSPEGELALAQLVVYLALAPKSNALYTALDHARQAAKKTSHLSPPSTILNAPTKLMKDLGYGQDYQYDHDTTDGFSGQDYFPPEMERLEFYHPVERGFEREMLKRKTYFDRLRNKLQQPKN